MKNTKRKKRIKNSKILSYYWKLFLILYFNNNKFKYIELELNNNVHEIGQNLNIFEYVENYGRNGAYIL